jgi:hypothetical protein
MDNHDTAREIVRALLSQDVDTFERTITDAITTVRQVLDDTYDPVCTTFQNTKELTCKKCGKYPWEHS